MTSLADCDIVIGMKSNDRKVKGKAKPVSFTLKTSVHIPRTSPSQELFALLLGYDMNKSADPSSHHLKSLIELKWCYLERTVALMLKVTDRKLGKESSNSEPWLKKDFENLRDTIRSEPMFKKIVDTINELDDKFWAMRDNRNTLVHGEIILEGNTMELHIPVPNQNYRTPVTPLFTSKIVMRNKEVTITLEHNELLSINKEFDEFIVLLRKLFLDLEADYKNKI